MIFGRTPMLLGILGPVLFLSGAGRAAGWPEVAPVSGSVYFGDSDSASATFTIFDAQGASAYLLECHNHRYTDVDFDYSGDWECRLRPTREKTPYSTLLTDIAQPARDWQSRARFLADQLMERKCADYPEYGALRHFRLRGMRLSLQLEDIRFKSEPVPGTPGVERPALRAFRFSFKVERDPSATSEIAEMVPFVEPPYRNPGTPGDYSRVCEVQKR
jgi:hypothetical protein